VGGDSEQVKYIVSLKILISNMGKNNKTGKNIGEYLGEEEGLQ
jgi:hypothetical protein